MEKTKKQEELGWILAKINQPSILSIDVDKFPLDTIKQYVEYLQKRENLGTAVITESSNFHYHVYFFWNLMEWDKLQGIIQQCTIADNLFKSFTKKNGFVRMRITNLYKPYLEIIPHKSTNSDFDLGDFYFKHYLYLLGFAPETIEYYQREVKNG